jgi:hypothetical protein
MTLRSKGSKAKSPSRSRGDVLDKRDWTTGSIAWNRDGNIVILDPRTARFLREKARVDRELQVGIPDVPVQVGDGSLAAGTTNTPGSAGTPVPQPLILCGCGVLRFLLDRELPARTKLLSPERVTPDGIR